MSYTPRAAWTHRNTSTTFADTASASETLFYTSASIPVTPNGVYRIDASVAIVGYGTANCEVQILIRETNLAGAVIGAGIQRNLTVGTNMVCPISAVYPMGGAQTALVLAFTQYKIGPAGATIRTFASTNFPFTILVERVA